MTWRTIGDDLFSVDGKWRVTKTGGTYDLWVMRENSLLADLESSAHQWWLRATNFTNLKHIERWITA